MSNLGLGPIEPDRAPGVLVGAAAGDALGAGYEFGAPYPAETVETCRSLTGRPAGSWTHDTDMAICIALVANSSLSLLDRVAGPPASGAAPPTQGR